MKFIPELAGLRGLAAIMVFIAHAALDGFLPKFIANTYGRLGLICFFILSGYLISQVYLFTPFNKKNGNSYVIARMARILPVYFVVILVSFVISNYIYTGFHYDFKDRTTLLLSLFLINTPFEPWTIPVEIHFYGSFLLFWYFYSTKSSNTWIFLIFPVILFLPSLFYAYHHIRVPHVMSSFAVFFFLGAFIASLYNKNYFGKLKTKIPKYVSLLFLLLFFIIFPLLRRNLGLVVFKTWYDPVSLFIISSLFILVITKPQDFFILRLRPLIFMSEISYGFYLIHRPVMKIMENNYGQSLFVGVMIFVISVILAWLSFKLIEVPARKFIEAKFNNDAKEKLKLS